MTDEQDQNQDDDRELLAREGVQSPAFWFFILAIPIVISLYLAFVRSVPAPEKPESSVMQVEEAPQERPQARRYGRAGPSSRTP